MRCWRRPSGVAPGVRTGTRGDGPRRSRAGSVRDQASTLSNVLWLLKSVCVRSCESVVRPEVRVVVRVRRWSPWSVLPESSMWSRWWCRSRSRCASRCCAGRRWRCPPPRARRRRSRPRGRLGAGRVAVAERRGVAVAVHEVVVVALHVVVAADVAGRRPGCRRRWSPVESRMSPPAATAPSPEAVVEWVSMSWSTSPPWVSDLLVHRVVDVGVAVVDEVVGDVAREVLDGLAVRPRCARPRGGRRRPSGGPRPRRPCRGSRCRRCG